MITASLILIMSVALFFFFNNVHTGMAEKSISFQGAADAYS